MHKVHSQENNGGGVLFIAVADKWVNNFSIRDFITDESCEVLQSINFTEQCCATHF